DTNSALGVFANNGLKGSDAGTSLKTMLSNLIPKSEGAYGAMRDLGIITKDGSNAFFDAKGNVKSMAAIAGVLKKSLSGLNAQQRQQALYTMFGSDAIRAATILYKEGADGIKKFNGEMSKVTALDVAKEKMNNAKGAVEQFKGALETLQISVLTPLMPVIKDAANKAADFVSKLSPKDIQSFGDKVKTAFQTALDMATSIFNFITQNWPLIRETIVGVTTAVVAFKAGMLALTIVQTITQLINGFRTAMAAAAVGQWAMNTAMWACPATWIVAAIAAVIAIGVLLYRNWDTVKSKAVALWNKMGFLKSIILALLGPIGALIKAGVYLYKNWDKVKAKMDSVWEGIKRAAAKAVNFIIDGINGMIRMINKIPGVNIPIVPKVDWGQSGINPPRIIRAGGALDAPDRMSHHGGISRVPYDGYSANLHKGERVLTKVEADAY
ncbi:phage tail tape measure protein, partial [Fictibacillus sp. Mic-4]|uniref:phage tail tape measure protein n=1 Tax=Fictibacillus sp. Mic-4 TaxID=3132826 RepID=UPI003CF96C6A